MITEQQLGVKASALMSDPVSVRVHFTPQIIYEWTHHVDLPLSCVHHVPGLDMAGPLPHTPGGSVYTREKMLLAASYHDLD